MFKRFFVYGLTGWGIEIAWTGFGSLLKGDASLPGFTSLWMFPIYGMAVFLEPLHDIMKDWNLFFRGLVWVVIIWGMEYTSGLIALTVLGASPWVYTGRFAVDGLIRLDYAPAWFAAGLLFERTHRKLDRLRIA